MSKKDRDYDVIIRGCRDMIDAVSALQSAAKGLKACAESAEATLLDRVGKKDIQAVKELSETIYKVTAVGEERIRELQKAMEREHARFRELEGR